MTGCGAPDDETVVLAKRLDWTTSWAHVLLRAGFDHTVASEDDRDHALLSAVDLLDQADRALPAHLEAYQRERTRGDSEDGARRAILNTLEVIPARYAAVVRTIQPRPTHRAVHDALSETPALVAEIRERIISQSD